MTSNEVDVYLSGLEEPKRSTLEALRRSIRAVVPDAEECISYGMPAFRVGGKVVAGFAAFKNHLAYLPHSGKVLADLGDALDRVRAHKWLAPLPDRRTPPGRARSESRGGETCSPRLLSHAAVVLMRPLTGSSGYENSPRRALRTTPNAATGPSMAPEAGSGFAGAGQGLPEGSRAAARRSTVSGWVANSRYSIRGGWTSAMLTSARRSCIAANSAGSPVSRRACWSARASTRREMRFCTGPLTRPATATDGEHQPNRARRADGVDPGPV